MHKLDDALQHTGVKGMRWGIRRNRNRPGGADGRPDASDAKYDKKTKLGKKLYSMKRERQWNKVIREMDNLSNEDITKITRRITLENSLKKLSKSRVAKSQDKKDYLERHKLSDEELAAKIVRLNAKENLHKAVKSASKEQRELGEKLVNIGGNLAFKYATKQPLGPKDVFAVINKPESTRKLLRDEAIEKAIAEAEAAYQRRRQRQQGNP